MSRLAIVVGVVFAGFLVPQAAGQQAASPTLEETPPARTSSREARFLFSSTSSNNFRCKLDTAPEEECESPKSYSALAEGQHEFSVRTLGPPSAPARYTWTIDVTAPQLTFAAPASDTSTDDATPTFAGTAGTATGDLETVVVAIFLAGSEGEPLVTLPAADVGEDGTWEVTPGEELAEGAYVATATQSDDVGNAATVERTFIIDLPSALLELAHPDGVVTAERSPVIAGTADGGTVSVDVHEEGVEGPPVAGGAATVEPTGDWSVTLDPPLDDGRYTIIARHFSGGAEPDAFETAPLVVDGTAPTLTVPADIVAEATSAAGALVTFDASAADVLDAAPAVACDPPSGATFALAPTPTVVTCTAVDHARNTDTKSFLVTVQNTVAPAKVAGFAAVAGNRIVVLAWRKPTNWDYDHVVISRARPGGPWTVIGKRAGETSFTDRFVANDRIYVYRVESVDTASNRSAPAGLRARPSAFFQPAYLATVRAPVLLQWTPVRRASYYNVQVWRNGRKILSRWPTAARYSLPSSWRYAGRVWRLSRGTYTVYAWPGFGSKQAARYGPLRGWTKFVVR